MASAMCSSALLQDYIPVISFCSCSPNDKIKTLSHRQWNSSLPVWSVCRGPVLFLLPLTVSVLPLNSDRFALASSYSSCIIPPSLPFFPKHHFDTNREWGGGGGGEIHHSNTLHWTIFSVFHLYFCHHCMPFQGHNHSKPFCILIPVLYYR